MNNIQSKGGAEIIKEIAAVIVANKSYLSEIDGKIGDGDHGVNMAKGFGRAAEKLTGEETLDFGLQVLSDVLMNEIGGSMGPLYGILFAEMGEVASGKETINLQTMALMLRAGLEGVSDIGAAKVGDKTLLDALVPAVEYVETAAEDGTEIAEALTGMKDVARLGRDSTIDMVAKIGRSARLGERSRGVLDAGATSCYLILETLADGIASRL